MGDLRYSTRSFLQRRNSRCCSSTRKYELVLGFEGTELRCTHLDAAVPVSLAPTSTPAPSAIAMRITPATTPATRPLGFLAFLSGLGFLLRRLSDRARDSHSGEEEGEGSLEMHL